MWNPDPPVPIMVLFPATLTENDRNCLLPNYKNLHLRFFFSFTIGLRTERIASSKTCEKVASRDKRLLYIARLKVTTLCKYTRRCEKNLQLAKDKIDSFVIDRYLFESLLSQRWAFHIFDSRDFFHHCQTCKVNNIRVVFGKSQRSNMLCSKLAPRMAYYHISKVNEG